MAENKGILPSSTFNTLGNNSNKWEAVYANKLVGPLTGNVTGNVSGSSGSCTGNAATATKATQDSAGQQINSTYIKGLSISGKTITYTKGNNTTGEITLPLQLTAAELHGNVIESISLKGSSASCNIYSDGWISQNGIVNTTPSNSFQTINLIKPFSNIDYQLIISYIVTEKDQTRTIYNIAGAIKNKTTTNFQVSRNQSNLTAIHWGASGK